MYLEIGDKRAEIRCKAIDWADSVLILAKVDALWRWPGVVSSILLAKMRLPRLARATTVGGRGCGCCCSGRKMLRSTIPSRPLHRGQRCPNALLVLSPSSGWLTPDQQRASTTGSVSSTMLVQHIVLRSKER